MRGVETIFSLQSFVFPWFVFLF